MKSFVTLCLVVLAGFVPATASVHRASSTPQNQFHFQPTGRRAKDAAARKANLKQGHQSVQQKQGPALPVAPRANTLATPKKARRHTANPPTGKIGFIAATQIPAGGGTYWAAVAGDFNGDGKPDIASEVEAWDVYTQNWVYPLSVVLNNGDGTFQAPMLNPMTDTCPALMAADVNGDGKTDLIIGHAPDTCGNSNSKPTFEIWLSKGDGTFTPSKNTNFTIDANNVSGGTVADVNKDTFLDIIAVDDANPATVWTFLGNGDGTFQAPTSVALSGQAGYDTVVADVSGDGLLDIIDNDYSTNQITVFLATADGGYATGVPYATSDSNYYACTNYNVSSAVVNSYSGSYNAPLAIGDLNGDGFPEIVNANCSDSGNDVTVYVNDRTGAFATGVYYGAAMSGGTNSGAATVYTESVAIADVNGDGFGDILAANNYSGDVTVLLGKADGTVTVPTVGYATGGYPWMPLLVADFNGDAFLDVVFPDDRFSFVYLQGYGDGGFRSALNYYAPTTTYSYWDYSIATGDFNKDGQPDFVANNWCSGCTDMGVTVYLSNPDGSLQGGINIGAEAYFGGLAVADFNGDGNLDIAATEINATLVQLFIGDGTGNFTLGSSFSTDLSSTEPYGIVAADFDKDGYTDLAIANWDGNDVAILLNDKSGNFPTPVPIALTGDAWQGIATADLNGDGNLDLVLAYYYSTSNAIGILLGNGDGTFQAETNLDGVPYPELMAIADLNGDSKLDLVATLNNGGGQDLAIALGNGDGTFGTPVILPSSLQDYNLNSPYPQGIQVADVDGDGKPDLVFANTNYGTAGVMFGKGDGTFYDPVEYPVGRYNWPLVIADVNGDGAPDAASSGFYFAGVTVLLNNNGSATQANYTLAPDVTTATIAAGESATFHLTITPTKHYNGTITFACPAGLHETMTCTFNPASVTLDGMNPFNVTLTITTAAPTTPAMKAAIDLPRNSRPGDSSMLLASLSGMGVFAMFLAGSLGKKRDRWSIMIALTLAMSLFFIGCGGSSNHTTPVTKSNTTSTVTSSNAKVVAGTAITFTGTVTGSGGTPTGTVTFLDGTTTLGTGTLSSGAATYQTSALLAGVHSITISYGGDSNFNTSTSAALSQEVQTPGTPIGPYTVTVTGTGSAGTNGAGAPIQSIPLTVTVQ